MMSLTLVFWIFVGLFALIGAMRGWAQELLVSFSVFLALFIITVLGLVPFIRQSGFLSLGFVNEQGLPVAINETTFWVRTAIVIIFAFFGYQTPRISTIKKAAAPKERLQDTILGIMAGAVNGYLIVGTLWFFLIQANYFLPLIFAPEATDETTIALTQILPPLFLTGTRIYFAIAIAFAFVVIVFI